MPNREHAREGASPSAVTAFVVPFLLLTLTVAGGVGWAVEETGLADEPQYVPDVVVVMKDKMYHVIQGTGPDKTLPSPAFSLAPGRDVVLQIRNEDGVAHEFVSPLLQKVDLQISGRATMVYTHLAAGVRVDPHESVLLRFDVPDSGFDQFHFWCNIHGKLFGDRMRGEIFILKELAH